MISPIFANRLDQFPAEPGGEIDFAAHGAVAEEVARQGIVLLRNERGALLLARMAQRNLVVGGNANIGVLSGAGSSQVYGQGGGTVCPARLLRCHNVAGGEGCQLR